MSPIPRCAVPLLIPLLLLAGCAPPQPEEPPEPAGPSPSEEAARSFFDALHAADWARCADILHPGALEEFDKVLRARMVAAAEAGQEQQVVALVDGVDNLDQLRALTPRDFFVGFLSTRIKNQPQTQQMLSTARTAVLGEIGHGDNRMLVVYEMTGTIGTLDFQERGVLTVELVGDVWKPWLSDELKRISQS